MHGMDLLQAWNDLDWNNMKFIRWTIRLFCTLGILVMGTYAVIGLIIAFFVATGRLTPGGDMFPDLATPTLGQALLWASVFAAITAGLAFARRLLSSDKTRSKDSHTLPQ